MATIEQIQSAIYDAILLRIAADGVVEFRSGQDHTRFESIQSMMTGLKTSFDPDISGSSNEGDGCGGFFPI